MIKVFALLNLLILGFLAWRYWRMREEIASLRARAEALDPNMGAIPPELAELFREDKSRILAIEILNPMELAAKESWFAGALGTISPGLLRKLVYERTAKIMQDQLKDFGVEAQVSIHRGR